MKLDGKFDRLIELYSAAFSIYADCYHMKKTGGGTVTMPRPDSMAEMAETAEKWGAILYGKDVLREYEEDPSRTILFVTHELTLTGAPMALLGLIESFRKRGWQVVVFSREDGAMGPLAAKKGIPVIAIPGLFRTDFIANVRTLFRAVIVNTIESAPAILQLQGTDTPVIWWVHESKAVYGKKNARLMPRALSDNIHVYCVGQYARRMLKTRAPRYRIGELLYCAADLSGKGTSGEKAVSEVTVSEDTSGLCDEGREPEIRKTYFSVGVIGRRKGQDVLLDAIGLLPEEIRNVSRFVFVGSAADADIEARILRKSRENPDQVIYYGQREPDELHDLYRTCDYLVCSSRDDPMPMVTAEAMSMGRPCICSANTGTAAIIRKYGAGMVYDHDDPRRLAKLIEDSFNMSGEDYDRFSLNARRAYEDHFSKAVFEKNVDRLIELIRRESK